MNCGACDNPDELEWMEVYASLYYWCPVCGARTDEYGDVEKHDRWR